jgi:hypothetical protein
MKMFKTLIGMISLASAAFAQQAEGPRELKVLTSQYERAVEKALDPITAKYLNALKRLKAKLAEAQKLEQALAVEAVINGLGDKYLALATDKIAGTSWTWNHSEDNDSSIRFKIDGTVDLSWKGEGEVRWRWLGNNQLTMSSSNGLRRLLTFNKEMTSYKGDSYSRKRVSKVWGDLKR